jgi:hypothetical protein
MGMSIREFIDQAPIESSEETFFDWYSYLKQGGWHSVKIGLRTRWEPAHQWCIQQYGPDHYTWTGNCFWFETEQDALLFQLTWS